MIKALITDVSRVLLFPKNKKYTGSLNELHKEEATKNDYKFFDTFELNEELLNFYKTVKDLHKIYILTSDVIQDDPALHTYWAGTIDKIFSASKMNTHKSKPEAYEKVLQELHLLPEEVLYIDDNEEYLEAAKSVGLQTVLYKDNRQATCDIQGKITADINKDLLERIEYIHSECNRLAKIILGTYITNSGNMGVFCQSDEEHNSFTTLREELCEPSENPNQKYYKLREPIIVPADGDVPETMYRHLYIRKPDPTPYGKYTGDVDFVMEDDEYHALKQKVQRGEIKGAEIYDRPGWDTIQLTNPQINAIAYVCKIEMAEKVRAKFD